MPNPQNLRPFKKGQSGNPGGKPKLTQEDRDAMAVLHDSKVEAAKLLAAGMRGKKVSLGAIRCAESILDRTEGKARQSITVQEQKQFVFLLPEVIENGDEWEAKYQQEMALHEAPKIIDAKAMPNAAIEAPVEAARERKPAPRPLDPTEWDDPALQRNPERDRALGRMPPLTRFDRN